MDAREVLVRNMREHTCHCGRILSPSERQKSRFNPRTLEHNHVCPECGAEWWHRNPVLEAAGVFSRKQE